MPVIRIRVKYMYIVVAMQMGELLGVCCEKKTGLHNRDCLGVRVCCIDIFQCNVLTHAFAHRQMVQKITSPRVICVEIIFDFWYKIQCGCFTKIWFFIYTEYHTETVRIKYYIQIHY